MGIVLTLIAVSASVLGAGMAYPQARKLVVTRRVDGVSPAWAGISVASNAWWLIYGVFAGVVALIPVSIVSIVLYLAICAALVRDIGRRALVAMVISGGLLALAPIPFLLAGGWPLAGVAVGLCYGVQLLPAVVAAYRTRALAGISAGTWVIAWVEAALWAVYASVVLDPALAIGGTVGILMSTAILVRLAVTGHRPLDAVGVHRLRFAR